MLIIIIITVPVAFLALLLTLPMKFVGVSENPVRLIEGRVVGLRVFIRTTTYLNNIYKDTNEDIAKLSVIERLRLTLALTNPHFNPSCVENYVVEPDEIIAEKGNNQKTWEELYSECDLNHDGKLTKREFTDWIIKEAMPWKHA